MEDQEDTLTKHAALILRQDLGTTVAQALFKAWCEGPVGYAKRLVKEAETKENDDDL
jgi:hypothetical protein